MFENGKTPDVVLKIPNLWLGIGDKFLVSGTDFNHAEDLERIILEDKEVNGVLLAKFSNRYLIFPQTHSVSIYQSGFDSHIMRAKLTESDSQFGSHGVSSESD